MLATERITQTAPPHMSYSHPFLGLAPVLQALRRSGLITEVGGVGAHPVLTCSLSLSQAATPPTEPTAITLTATTAAASAQHFKASAFISTVCPAVW